MKCRLLTAEDQIQAVERKLGRKLNAVERFDVVDDAQDYVCSGSALGRRGARRPARRRRRH